MLLNHRVESSVHFCDLFEDMKLKILMKYFTLLAIICFEISWADCPKPFSDMRDLSGQVLSKIMAAYLGPDWVRRCSQITRCESDSKISEVAQCSVYQSSMTSAFGVGLDTPSNFSREILVEEMRELGADNRVKNYLKRLNSRLDDESPFNLWTFANTVA